MSAVENLRQELTTLEGEYGALLATAGDEQAIRKVYADFGGADGAIRKRHKAALAAAPGPEKRDIGKLGNEILQRVEKLAARGKVNPNFLKFTFCYWGDAEEQPAEPQA